MNMTLPNARKMTDTNVTVDGRMGDQQSSRARVSAAWMGALTILLGIFGYKTLRRML